MANYNKVILMGNLTRDPELRYTPNGTAVSTLSLAVNRRPRPDTQEKEVDFFDVVVFGKQAENCSEYLRKGSPIHRKHRNGRTRLVPWRPGAMLYSLHDG